MVTLSAWIKKNYELCQKLFALPIKLDGLKEKLANVTSFFVTNSSKMLINKRVI